MTPAAGAPRRVSLWLALAGVIAVLLATRIAALPENAGICWDSSAFTDPADHLDEVIAGDYPSIFGQKRTYVPPVAYPLALRALRLVFGTTVAGGVFLAVASGAVMCLVAFALGARLHSREAGLLAALLIALDPDHAVYESVVASDPPFGLAVALGAVLLATNEPLRPGRALGGLAALAVSSAIRFTGGALFLLGAAFAVWRVERSQRAATAAGALLLLALVQVPQARLNARTKGGVPWQGNALGSLSQDGLYPDYADVDAEGGTMRCIGDPPPVGVMLREHAGFFVKVTLRSLSRIFLVQGAPLALAVLALVAWRRERAPLAAPLFTLAVFAVGALFPIATFVPWRDMRRMMMPVTPELYALAACGAWRLATWSLERFLGPGRPQPGWRRDAVALVAGLAVAFLVFDLGRLPSPLGLRRIGDPTAPWARSREFAARVQRMTPEDARIGRGPGGLQDLHALFARHTIMLPATTPPRFQRYLELNRVAYILHGDRPDEVDYLERQVAPHRLVPLARLEAGGLAGEGQIVSLVQ
jgi:hypothetical protein